jgi:hypothetical protein
MCHQQYLMCKWGGPESITWSMPDRPSNPEATSKLSHHFEPTRGKFHARTGANFGKGCNNQLGFDRRD